MPRIRFLTVVELDNPGGHDPEHVFTAFQEDVEASRLATHVERARLEELEEFARDSLVLKPGRIDAFVPCLDSEPDEEDEEAL